MKFGFIGAGNMVGAIVKGMTIGTQSFKGSDIYVTSKGKVSAQNLAEVCGCHFCETSVDVVANSDVVILGVKPHILEQILPDLLPVFTEKKPIVVSIAAGKTLDYLASLLPAETKILRVMPNINAKIGASTSGICGNAFVTETETTLITNMFQTVGSVIPIDEAYFSQFMVIGGSSVAFVYLYMDALAHAGVKAGLSKKQALEIAAETVLGSAKMILESGEAPWQLIDQVCSPGGTTIEGVLELQANGFESTIAKAFDAVLAKDKLLGAPKK
ncbi:pyrroline-5-carboxylate reductase [Chakrabartyella piscis]|uniref:pyrroline-5-carboxylate reductase n=1 Tax=Chakrabartyella piscis TaxID=2918914 RepID=UPI0029584A0F|nr:pyrroline-5-carboxylate reductase [Chakrabartyella piscis]